MEEDDGCSGPPSFDDSHLRLPPLVSLPDFHETTSVPAGVRADGAGETFDVRFTRGSIRNLGGTSITQRFSPGQMIRPD
jgi:hypothetical protein